MAKASFFSTERALHKTGPLAPIRTIVTLLLGGILVLSLLLIGSTVSANDDLLAGNTDDGWRRTVDGWEQKASWNVSASMLRIKVPGEKRASALQPDWDRYAIHPAALSAALILIAWVGLRLQRKKP